MSRLNAQFQTLLEEKFQIEMEISRKCAELESQLILERNIKPGLESEVCRLSSENELLCQRLRSSEDLLADKKRLQNAVEKLEKEKNTISEELCLQKLSAVEVRPIARPVYGNSQEQPYFYYSNVKR